MSEAQAQAGRGTFLRNALLLEALAAYGNDLLPSVPSEVEASFDHALVEYMSSAAGRAEVKEWSELFRRTLVELADLRNLVAHRPEQVAITELQEGLIAEERALDGLRSWLSALSREPHPQAS